MSNLIHFAHGNGFPSGCYKQLLERLANEYDYCSIDRIGHDPKYPISDNWSHLVAEVTNSIVQQTNQPVVAVGHSLGGVISLLAAIAQPSLFKAVVLLDSPLLGPFKSNIVRLAKTLCFIDRITPAFRCKNRREHWADREQLYEYLKTRDLFKTFTPECLEDYITYGFIGNDKGYSLRFDRYIEYQIYRTIPHILPQFQRQLITPTALIYGDKSTTVGTMDRDYMDTYFGIKSHKVDGSHLFPMEYPSETADCILRILRTI
jgi:pimeloyl-ACP methyl ester carboxylesterase